MTTASLLRDRWLPGTPMISSEVCPAGAEDEAEATTRALIDGLLAAFEEDLRTIDSQAANRALAPEKAMLVLVMDEPLVHYRRLCERALEAGAQ